MAGAEGKDSLPVESGLGVKGYDTAPAKAPGSDFSPLFRETAESLGIELPTRTGVPVDESLEPGEGAEQELPWPPNTPADVVSRHRRMHERRGWLARMRRKDSES